MNHYYLNKNSQPTGEKEIHKSNCSYLPSDSNRIYLGYFTSFTEAKKEAKQYYDNVDGCLYCCPEGHKK